MATIQYTFDGTSRSIEPKISFTFDTKGHQVEELSNTTRRALKDLLNSASISQKFDKMNRAVYDPLAEVIPEESFSSIQDTNEADRPEIDQRGDTSGVSMGAGQHDILAKSTDTSSQTIQIKLDSDVEFFSMLSDEVDRLDDLQSREKSMVLTNIEQLGSQISKIVRPNNKGKTNADLEAWRQVLRLYQDAGIFKPASEHQRKSHTPAKAAKQLTWFVKQVDDAGLIKKELNRGQSRALYNAFNALNFAILQQIKFHSMNQEAMGKILKKFDKRTALTARTSFPTFMAGDPFFVDGLAQAMYYSLASNVMAVVPQLDDYECPVCTSITIKPVRLNCSHVFCVRCLVRLQLSRENHCPICRRENVLQADSTNIDWALLNFLKMYFPIESKAKQKENEQEQLRAQVAATGMDTKACTIM